MPNVENQGSMLEINGDFKYSTHKTCIMFSGSTYTRLLALWNIFLFTFRTIIPKGSPTEWKRKSQFLQRASA